MTPERVTELALANGFKLKEQADGTQALNAYVFDFVAAIQAEPIDMVLHCPACGTQHIDAAIENWNNPPHRSHFCMQCACIWRPADVNTNGVAAVQTKGKHDSEMVQVTEEDNSEDLLAAIGHINRARLANSDHQKEHTVGSAHWHALETLDDELFKALEKLGD